MEKVFIKNRKNKKISVMLERKDSPIGVALVMHGLGAFKEQPQVQAIAQAFLDNNYSVVRFDTTNSLGESDGKHEYATTTNFYQDLEDVLMWSETQSWYEEPFALAGQSLGGISVGLYAERFPNKVKNLILINSTISGEKSLKGKDQKQMEEWKKTGWQITESISRPGVIKRLPWSHMEDRLKFDLYPLVSKLTMNVLIITGEVDNNERPGDQEDFFKAIPGNKEFIILPGVPHTIRDEVHLDLLTNAISSWLKKHGK
jgi:pimeloyl-ACP methyl ester carboxylesterase